MNESIRELEPKELWNSFADLNAVPRPSKKEERVRAFMKDFGAKLGLETLEDEVGNILIKKPATSGYENNKTVVLQSHLDMVCQKNNDTVFDFDTEGIKMLIEGDWVKADGTTLGADNGIGVASMMAILASKEIEHPTLEALFTIDEETGMTGAFGLSSDFLSGEILLNLDTEEDDKLDIGCAGGVDVSAKQTFEEIAIPSDYSVLEITIKGLHGGHSGIEINKGLGNSNKIITRLLFNSLDLSPILCKFDGGGLRNAIPREASVIVAIDANKEAKLIEFIEEKFAEIKAEFSFLEEGIELSINKTTAEKGISAQNTQKVLYAIQGAHNGVFRMSPDIENLVEASNNLARVEMVDGICIVQCLTRSSVDSTKMQVANTLRAVFELAGFKVELAGTYPGWKPNPNSDILDICKKVYVGQNNGKQAIVEAVHAGLECGLIGEKYPKMEMISFGPTILGAHSPKERANIPSVSKYWKFLLEVLKNIPNK